MKKNTLKIIPLSFLFLFGTIIFSACNWAKSYFNAEIGEIIFTIATGAKGTDKSIIYDGFAACLPVVICLSVLYAVMLYLAYISRIGIVLTASVNKLRARINIKRILAFALIPATVVYFAASVYHMDKQYGISDYLKQKASSTTIYEDYYADPDTVSITGSGRNLIMLYVESLETAYTSVEKGGFQDMDYIPYLSQLATKEISFSDRGTTGGFHGTEGSDFTVGALFSIPSGIPFAFPVNGNEMGKYETFAAGTVNLYDILERNGYNQYFVCGSDASYGARDKLFTSHGIDEVYDYFTAINEGYVPADYHVAWGIEDYNMFNMAKDKLLSAAQNQPFSFSMLTVDTHFPEGYICDLCTGEHDTITKNVVQCTDRQVEDFINWCKQQSFYENTTIVIMGDHPRMDLNMVEGIPEFDRTVYTCFVNSNSPLECSNFNRCYTQLDMFPTILSSMGYSIEGNRLALGANLFSEEPTLAEQLGFEVLDDELHKSSSYYINNFS